jgi:hypothetical protein
MSENKKDFICPALIPPKVELGNIAYRLPNGRPVYYRDERYDIDAIEHMKQFHNDICVGQRLVKRTSSGIRTSCGLNTPEKCKILYNTRYKFR